MGKSSTHKEARLPQRMSNSISSSYQSQGEWPRRPFTARIERPPSIHMILLSLSIFSPGKGTHVGPRAAVERGPSQGARSGSTGPTWVSFPSFLSRALREHRRSSGPIPLSYSHWPSPPHNFSPSISTSRAHNAIRLHLLDHPSRPRVAHPEPALNQRRGG